MFYHNSPESNHDQNFVHRPHIRVRQVCKLLAIFAILFVTLITHTDSASASSSFNLKRKNTQGSTITKDYFFFVDWSESNTIDVYRCNRTEINFSDCKKIVSNSTSYGHANAMQYTWGSQYFWLFDNGNPKSHGRKWCFDFDGNVVDHSKCGFDTVPNNNEKNSEVPQGSQKQGYCGYEGYFIKGSSGFQGGPNKIFVRKNEKDVKTIDAKFNSQELEDVSVDGDTGEIYYTTAHIGSGEGNSKLYLHKVSGYKLPVVAGGGSSGGSSNSGGSKGQDSTRVKPVKQKTPADVTHPKSSYDGSVATTFFGTIRDDGKGCGVFSTLALIIDILTLGVGIAAVIGIVLTGYTILMSKGEPERVAKAKRRLLEIILGIALYAVMYTILGFLLPGGTFNDQKCSTAYTQETTIEFPHYQA